MSEVFIDLLGDPLPEPIPSNEQLTEWHELVGHTIKAVINCPTSDHKLDAILITETNCWMGLVAETDSFGNDRPTLQIVGERYQDPRSLSAFASAQELKSAACINEEQFQHLKASEVAAKKKLASAQAVRYRAQADQLEAEAKL